MVSILGELPEVCVEFCPGCCPNCRHFCCNYAECTEEKAPSNPCRHSLILNLL